MYRGYCIYFRRKTNAWYVNKEGVAMAVANTLQKAKEYVQITNPEEFEE